MHTNSVQFTALELHGTAVFVRLLCFYYLKCFEHAGYAVITPNPLTYYPRFLSFFLCTIFILLFYFSIIPFFYFYDFSFLLYVWKFIFLMNYLIILKLLLYKYSKIYLFDFYSLVVYTCICIMTQSCFSFTFLLFCEKVQHVYLSD